MRTKILTPAFALALLAGFASMAAAQAPPKGTTRADCRANPEWRWLGYKTQAGGWKGRCVRKVGKTIKDTVAKVKKAVPKKKSGNGGGS